MEMFLLRHSQWEALYNCTGFYIDAVPLERRRQFVPEAWVLVCLCAIYYLLYVPCMASIWRHSGENVCYKLLFHIGLLDLAILWVLGFVQAWYSLTGSVFCSSPVFNYWIGILATFSWFAESSIDLVLAFNRCLDMIWPSLANKLFSVWRTNCWLAVCILYALYWVFFQKPIIYSSLIFTWPFDPFFGYREDTSGQFDVPLHAIYDGAVTVLFPLMYTGFSLAIWINSKSPGLDKNTTTAQRMAFLQVFIISLMNSSCSSVYMAMHFFEPPQWLLVMAQFAWFHVHGFPPVIYLLLNKTIRNDCKKMFYKVFRPNHVQHLNAVTLVLPGGKHVGIGNGRIQQQI